ncbi:MAG TPA: MFS transporter [Candidatus Limnocylindrales bacterium]|nr:MFS transporter [Candidatus Limnocylindrales bacterium]
MSRAPEAAARPRLVTPAFAALAAATLAFFIAGGLVLPIAPRFAKLALGADALGFGIAMGAFSVASLVLRPVVGWASDRFGRRPLLLGGALLNVLALGLHLLVADLATFTAVRALLGVAEGFFLVAAFAAASDIAPEARRGEAISFLSLSLYLGLAIGPPVAELVLGAGSYPAVWLAAGALAVVAVALVLLIPESAPAVIESAGGRRSRLIHPAGIFPGLVIVLGLCGMAAFLTFVPLYAPAVGMDGAGLPLAIYALIVVALRIVGATWPDRFGAARLSSAALALSAVGLTVIGSFASPMGLLLGTVVFAAGVAFTMPALIALAVSRVSPTERGSVVGTTTIFLDVVFGIAPAGLSLIADAAGHGIMFLVSAALAGVAAALLASRRRRLEAEASARSAAPAVTTG